MSTIIATTLSNGSVSVPTATVVNGSAKAWVNFNGTGTVAIQDSFNIASITDAGTGDFDGNFTAAMPDANYSTQGATQTAASGAFLMIDSQSVSSVNVRVGTVTNPAGSDRTINCVSIFS